MVDREESDQLPEEQQSGAVPDDAGGPGDARDDAQESAGVPGEEESGGAGGGDDAQATGNPANAGEDD